MSLVQQEKGSGAFVKSSKGCYPIQCPMLLERTIQRSDVENSVLTSWRLNILKYLNWNFLIKESKL